MRLPVYNEHNEDNEKTHENIMLIDKLSAGSLPLMSKTNFKHDANSFPFLIDFFTQCSCFYKPLCPSVSKYVIIHLPSQPYTQKLI